MTLHLAIQDPSLTAEISTLAQSLGQIGATYKSVKDLNLALIKEGAVVAEVNEAEPLPSFCATMNSLTVPVILVSTLSRAQNLVLLKSCPNLKALCDRHSRTLSEQLRSALGKVTSEKRKAELAHWLLESEVLNSGQIHELLDKVENLAKQQPGFSNLPKLIRTVASELIRNLIIAGSKSREDQIPLNFGQTIILNLKESEKILFRCRVEAPYFVLQVSDSTGALNYPEIFNKLHKYSLGTEKMATGDDLIGLGLYLAYNICSELIFDVRPGAASTITAKVLLSKKNRDFDSQKTSIQL